MNMRLKKTNQEGLTHFLFIFVLLAVVVLVGYVGLKRIQDSSADTVGDFTYLATHPQAAVQSTAEGKILMALQAWSGKLYAGFGDYGTNTGPIAITPFDPTTNTFAAAPSVSDGTEQIALFRVLNGKIYAPSIDPHDASAPSYDAVGTSDGKWVANPYTAATGLTIQHVFDMTTLSGSDLWIAGSNGDDAVVYRSADGGSTWTKSLDIAVSGNAERFYGIGSFGGKLYVQASQTDSANTAVYPMEASSHVFDGTNWTKGPNLGSGYYFWHPEVFAGKMIYLNNCACNGGGYGTLYGMTSTGAVQVYSSAIGGVYDYTVDGSTMYVLGTSGKVYSTVDLTNWYLQRTGPTNAHSLAVLNGQLYVGTGDSKIYEASVNTSPTPVGSGSTSGGTTTTKHGKGGGGGGGNGHKK
jgi:hypothetical protein